MSSAQMCVTTSASESGAPAGSACAVPFKLAEGGTLFDRATSYGAHDHVSCPVEVDQDTRVLSNASFMATAVCHCVQCTSSMICD